MPLTSLIIPEKMIQILPHHNYIIQISNIFYISKFQTILKTDKQTFIFQLQKHSSCISYSEYSRTYSYRQTDISSYDMTPQAETLEDSPCLVVIFCSSTLLAPTSLSTSFPSLKNKNVGIALIPHSSARV